MNKFREPHGINLRCEDYVPIAELSTALCNVLSFLQSDSLYAKLFCYDDWWQHDGLHFYKGTIDFHKLFQIAETSRSLYEAMPDDYKVRIGVAPADFKWYLRMFADWDEADMKIEGNFDITLPTDLADRFRAEVAPKLPCSLIEESAETYYERIKG